MVLYQKERENLINQQLLRLWIAYLKNQKKLIKASSVKIILRIEFKDQSPLTQLKCHIRKYRIKLRMNQ